MPQFSKRSTIAAGLSIILILLILFTGCDSGHGVTGERTTTTSGQDREFDVLNIPAEGGAIMLTGSGADEIEWRIVGVKNRHSYLNKEGIITNGDAVVLVGEAKGKKNIQSAFLHNNEPLFLIDGDGSRFEMQLPITFDCDPYSPSCLEFIVSFSPEANGVYNPSISPTADLMLLDPSQENQQLPQHSVDLIIIGTQA